MQPRKKLTLQKIESDLITYFNWSANALMPVDPRGADIFLKQNRAAIIKVAQALLSQVGYAPGPVYRGIILKLPVEVIVPHKSIEYLSFSTDWSVADHFADIKGFGSDILNLANQLGRYGYVIEYTPQIAEVLFHYHFLSVLPYEEAFTLLGMDGHAEVESLKKQKEVMIQQPRKPFVNITKKFDSIGP